MSIVGPWKKVSLHGDSGGRAEDQCEETVLSVWEHSALRLLDMYLDIGEQRSGPV